MDRTDLVRQLSNLITQISAAGKTQIQSPPASAEASAQLQMREALLGLLSQPQNGQVLARWDPVQQPAAPVIPAEPKGEHLVSILIKGQRFLLSTALDLKPGMTVRFALQGDRIHLQAGPISPPTAQLNAAIQNQAARAPSAAPPPIDTNRLHQSLQQPANVQQTTTLSSAQLQQISTLLQQLPTLSELTQTKSLEGIINDNRPPLVQQLNQLLQKAGTLPQPTQPSLTTDQPSAVTTQPNTSQANPKVALLTSLLQLNNNRNLPLLVNTLVQALAPPATAAPAPEAQPLALQLPSLSYPFPQKSSPAERNADVGTLLKRMAIWFKNNQEQQQLHQLLQLQSANPADELARPTPQLWLEIPFRVDQQLHWMQLHLQHSEEKKQQGDESEQEPKDQVWQLQLRLERPETGAVFASIYFRKPKLDVQFWAEQPDTLNKLRAALPQFTDILKSEGVEECSVAANPGAMTTATTALDQRRLHLEA